MDPSGPRMTAPWAPVAARSAESSPHLSSGRHGLGHKLSNPYDEGGGLAPRPSLLLRALKSGLKGPLAVGLENQSPG